MDTKTMKKHESFKSQSRTDNNAILSPSIGQKFRQIPSSGNSSNMLTENRIRNMRITDYFQQPPQSSDSMSAVKSIKSIMNETSNGSSFKDMMLQTLGSRGSRLLNQQSNFQDRL